MPPSSDPYKILGVSKTATQDEIRTAYRTLAKKLHPDLNPGNKEAEKKFKALSSAYELVGDEKARAKFDRGEVEEEAFRNSQKQRAERGPYYSHTQEGGGRYSTGGESEFGGGFNFGGDDLFESLFRSRGQQRGSRGSSQGFGQGTGEGPVQGQDQLYQMDVDFRDSILGAEKEIQLNNGKKLRIKIPPGIETGKRLRFKGQGGVSSGMAGDAYIEVSVQPSPIFTRSGDNIETEASIGFEDAVLGGEISVPTLEGPVLLKIPEGVSTGAKLRVRGKGVPTSATHRGDQIVSLKVTVPKGMDQEFKNELKESVKRWKERQKGGTHAV